MPASELYLRALPNIPAVKAGDHLPELILQSLESIGLTLQADDILVISSKIVSKSENRFVDLRTVTASARAQELAIHAQKDPRIVELVLQESTSISRVAPHVLIVRHRLGFTSANAGIDQSNTGYTDGDMVLLLPHDPDASAKRLALAFEAKTGVRPAIVISDTHGRPFRVGNLNVAIGLYGVPAVYDQRGETDLFGRTLQATITAFADQVAAAAGLLSGEASEGQPVILLRGLTWPKDQEGRAADINRAAENDLYQ